MQINLKIWRQTSPDIEGVFEEYKVDNVCLKFGLMCMINNM